MTPDFPESETETPGIGNTPRPRRSAAKKSPRKRPSPIPRHAGENSHAIENESETTSRAGRVLNKGRKVLSRAYDSMPDMHMPRRRDFESMMEANPLILGAVGLGLGVVIGSLLPRNTIDGGMQAMGLSMQSRSGSRRGGKSSRGSGPQRKSSSRGRSRNGGSQRGGGSNDNS